jgi:hypothetical protein
MTRLHHLLVALIGLSAVGSACSDVATTGPQLVDHDVQGQWHQPGLFPGSAFQFGLTENSGALTGTGTFAVEAGAGGTVAVSGSVRSDSLHLQVVFKFDPRFTTLQPDTAAFEGVLVARDTINGTLTHAGTVQSIQLVRLQAGEAP